MSRAPFRAVFGIKTLVQPKGHKIKWNVDEAKDPEFPAQRDAEWAQQAFTTTTFQGQGLYLGPLCLYASSPIALDLCTPLMEAMTPAPPEHAVLIPPSILRSWDLLLSLLFSLTCLGGFCLTLLQLPRSQRLQRWGLAPRASSEVLFYSTGPPACHHL